MKLLNRKVRLYIILNCLLFVLLNGEMVFGQSKNVVTTIKKAVPTLISGKQAKGIGETATQTIGTEGGSISSEDGLMTVTVPAGALSADREIGIQMIESTNPAAFGFSYRITPHNVSFNKPVTLSFKYEDELLDKINPSVLFISTFDKGKWLAMAGTIDETRKVLCFETLHFSDWSMVNSIKITPRFQYLADGENSFLEIMEYGIDPQKLKEGKTILIQPPKRIDAHLVKNWSLHGRGDLQHLGSSATYTAPKSTHNPEIDEIVATVDYQNGTLLLYAWVSTLRPGVYFEAEGKDYFFPNVRQWYNGYISDQTGQGSFYIKIHGEQVNTTGQWTWMNKGGKPTTFLFETPTDADGNYITYTSYQYPDESSEQKDSNGKIQIFYFGPDDDYVSGRFTITNAGKFTANNNSITRKSQIKGYFRIYHWKENKFLK